MKFGQHFEAKILRPKTWNVGIISRCFVSWWQISLDCNEISSNGKRRCNLAITPTHVYVIWWTVVNKRQKIGQVFDQPNRRPSHWAFSCILRNWCYHCALCWLKFIGMLCQSYWGSNFGVVAPCIVYHPHAVSVHWRTLIVETDVVLMRFSCFWPGNHWLKMSRVLN